MKFTLSFSAATIIAVCAASAQEPARPLLRSTPPSPLAPPPALTNDTLPLIPETPDTIEKPRGSRTEPKNSGLSQPKKDKTSSAEDELTARIRLRQLKTRALKEQKIQGEWDRAHAAKTDLEKREALVSYYTLLYGRMEKFDGSLKKRIGLLRDTSLKRLTQHNIEPTESLELRTRDERDQ